jgi:hypothetical protein
VLDAIGKQSAELEARFDAIGGPVGQGAIDAVDNLGDEFSTTALAAKSLTTELLAIISPPVTAGLKGLALLLAATRHAITGGSNEQVNLDNRIKQLQFLINNPGARTEFVENEAKATQKLRIELEELLLKQEELSGTGRGGLLNPKMQQFPVNLPNPLAGGDLQFQESDEDRAKRLKEEEQQRNDRINFAANVHQIEEDMAFRSSLKLAEIDQKRLDDESASARRTRPGDSCRSSDGPAGVPGRRAADLRACRRSSSKRSRTSRSSRSPSGMFGMLARENSEAREDPTGYCSRPDHLVDGNRHHEGLRDAAVAGEPGRGRESCADRRHPGCEDQVDELLGWQRERHCADP